MSALRDLDAAEQMRLNEAACEVLHDAYVAATFKAGWRGHIAHWADVPAENQAAMRTAVAHLLTWLDEQ